jgi:hypothetical protein
VTPEETLVIKTLTLEKIRRTAVNYISPALLAAGNLEFVADQLAHDMVRAMFTVYIPGKPEVSDWTERESLVTAPGIWNNVKAWLILRWARATERRAPRWMTPQTLPTLKRHHHEIYHVCPHVNDWTDKDTRMLHFRFLESTPVPPKQDIEL